MTLRINVSSMSSRDVRVLKRETGLTVQQIFTKVPRLYEVGDQLLDIDDLDRVEKPVYDAAGDPVWAEAGTPVRTNKGRPLSGFDIDAEAVPWLIYLTMRRTDPDYTFEQALDHPLDDLEWGDDELDPSEPATSQT